MRSGAEIDVVVAFSNCPQVYNARNAFKLRPLKAMIYDYKPYCAGGPRR